MQQNKIVLDQAAKLLRIFYDIQKTSKWGQHHDNLDYEALDCSISEGLEVLGVSSDLDAKLQQAAHEIQYVAYNLEFAARDDGPRVDSESLDRLNQAHKILTGLPLTINQRGS